MRPLRAHLVISLYSDLSWKIKVVRRKTSSRRDIGDNLMRTSLVRRGRLRAPQSFVVLALLVLTSVKVSPAQNIAVRFIDSQPVPVSNFCFNTYDVFGASGQDSAIPGHFHAGSLMDLRWYVPPIILPGRLHLIPRF